MHDVIKLSAPETQEFWKISILYEDEHLLAIDKPSRLLTSPDRYDPQRPNLMRLLHRGIELGAPWARQRQLTYLMNAHRLDFETSGILLLAKNKPALVALANQFGSEKPEKRYLALVHGIPNQKEFVVEARLSPHPVKVGLIRVDPKNGKRCMTRFEVQESFNGHALVHAYPVTGRTHQIRVHLRHAGFPIVGDDLYGGRPLLLSQMKQEYRLKGDKQERPLISRVALHAETLTLPHPVNDQKVAITAPWPKDLQVAIKYLKRYQTKS